MMAQKEATVFIVDVGKSMGEKNGGREETDLEWAMRYVWDRITTTVATGRKTAHIGMVALRSDETNNDLSGDDSYDHISVLQPIDRILMSNLRDLRDLIKPSQTDFGDALSALVVAIQMITSHCKKLQYIRQIVLVTNGRGLMDPDDLDAITIKLTEDGIELVVLGIDFDDPDYGYKEEDKPNSKARNEKVLKSLTEKADGNFGTMAQAVEELSIPRLKTTKPMPLYKGTLTLGNPEDYESALAIDVERYARVMQAKPPTASSFVVKSDLVPGDSSTQSSTTLMNGDSENKDGLSAVKSTRTYQVKDGNAPGGKRDVDREELARGYAYGAHAVPLGESEQNVTQFETTQSFTIMGFIPANEYRRFMDMTRSHLIVAQRTNEKAKLALSSFVNALYEAESFAVARFVQKDWKQPVLLILAPAIEPDYEGLIDIEIPFAEDVRPYRFPALDRITTVSGKVLTQHRNLPDEKLMRAMSQYVDHMDLSTFGRDDEGNPTEYLSMDDTYSPVLHRLNQAIRWRAVRPTEDVPRPSEVLTQPSNPPQELIESSKPYLEALQAAGDVKKVPPKQLSRKRGREYAKPLSGLDVDELLNRDKRRKISPDNAVPEYKQMLETSEDPGIIGEATKQMSKIVQDLVRHSVGDSGYGRAMECTRVMREELIEFEEPGLFNDFVKELKKKLLAGELGGDRMEMWWLLRVNRLGLIDKKASPSSSVTEEEARSFLSAK